MDPTAELTTFRPILVDCAEVETDMSDLLFEPPLRFGGLPAEGFRVFSIRDREERRRAHRLQEVSAAAAGAADGGSRRED